MEIKKVVDESFRKYGRVIKNYDLDELCELVDRNTEVSNGVIYQPSVDMIEDTDVFNQVMKRQFGGMPIQMGYCIGINHNLNAVEYHRTSEVNIAVTDFIVLVGLQQDIEDDYTYDTSKIEAFYVEKGSMVEFYATTLHYAPCSVGNNVFKSIVVLPKGTNTPLEGNMYKDDEDRLLFAKNKWLIGHPDTDLDKDGAFIGLKGTNLTV